MAEKSGIKNIKAREILDSRGNPTVEVELTTERGVFWASVPSGASKGKYEAKELSDGRDARPSRQAGGPVLGKRYQGRGVLKAVNNVNKIIAPKLRGRDPAKQKEIDDLVIKLDGTKDKSKLGANAILAVSMAVCRAGAAAQSISLYKYIKQLTFSKVNDAFSTIVENAVQFLKPCFNVINGGAHAGNELDFQEFMVVPQSKFFSKNFQIGAEIYQELKKIIKEKYSDLAINVGDEGGFAPPLKKPEAVLDLILRAIKNLGYQNKIKIILDVASSQFFTKDSYKMKIGNFTKEDLINYYLSLIQKYPISGLEDPFSEDDWQGWHDFKLKIKNEKLKTLIIGDDLTVTNPDRIREAQDRKACNAVVIKPNQIGTVSETIEAAKLAKSFGWKIIVSHRSGETCDDFISDLAVGIGADFIKAGAPARGERVAKYNRLLRIEEEFRSAAQCSLHILPRFIKLI